MGKGEKEEIDRGLSVSDHYLYENKDRSIRYVVVVIVVVVIYGLTDLNLGEVRRLKITRDQRTDGQTDTISYRDV